MLSILVIGSITILGFVTLHDQPKEGTMAFYQISGHDIADENGHSHAEISVVSPAFNEEACIAAFTETVTRVLDSITPAWEIIFVDDGSRDGTYEKLCELRALDSRVKILRFSRNFGNQIALSAGLEHASGDAVIIMDSDLQHPPEMIPEMVRLWKEEKYHSVYTIRSYGPEIGVFKRFSSRIFNKVLNTLSDLDLPEGISDFRLLDRKIVDYIKDMRESSRFLRALISWLGFRQIGISYTSNPRVAGTSKFSFSRLLKLSIDGITGFSIKPLRWITYFGMLVAFLGVSYACYVIYETFFLGLITPGWPTLIIAVLVMGGLQLISLGVIGEYVGKIYMETKRRPLFAIQEKHGFPPKETVPLKQHLKPFDENQKVA